MQSFSSVIVTGAGHGIGRTIATTFAQAGYAVCATDLRADWLVETEAALVALAGAERTLTVAADLTETEAPARIVAEAIARFGRLDAIVNNAADQRGLDTENTPIALFDAIQAVNVRAPFLFAQAALPHLKASKGALVQMGSLVGNQPIPERVAYSTSKAALAGLTRALATDLGRYGIRVNAIAPGHIMTDGEAAWKERYTPAEQAVFFTHYPLERVGTSDDIAQVALFLCSPAASFITGATIPVDGGMSVLCPEIGAFRAAGVRWPGSPGA